MKQLEKIALLFLFGCTVLVWSCAPPGEQEAKKPDRATLDSIHQSFVDLWNAQDVDGLSNSLTESVTFMSNAIDDGKYRVKGQGNVTEHWIEEGATAMKDLKAKLVSSGTDLNTMYTAGTYEHNLMPEDSLIGPFRGQYTFIWTRQKDDSWKLNHIHLQQTDSPMRRQMKQKQEESGEDMEE